MGIRSFIAINFSEEVKKPLENLISELKKDLPKVRFIEGKNLHLTLRFLGYISDKQLETSVKSLENLVKSFKPFTLEFNRLLAFPSFINPGIIGVKIRNSKALLKIHQRVNTEFNHLKIGQEEKREFKPHVTIARVKDKVGDIRRANIDFKFLTKVESIELMKSTLSQAGANYEIIQGFSLCQE